MLKPTLIFPSARPLALRQVQVKKKKKRRVDYKQWSLRDITPVKVNITHLNVCISQKFSSKGTLKAYIWGLNPWETWSHPVMTFLSMIKSLFACGWSKHSPLTGRSVPISVRQRAASTHTHIKLTCKTKKKQQIVNNHSFILILKKSHFILVTSSFENKAVPLAYPFKIEM